MERTAQKAYNGHMENIVKTMREIQIWIDSAWVKDGVDWGDVGDVTEVDTQLRQVLEFIKGIPQG